jgi:arylsulfatase A-like enzyme
MSLADATYGIGEYTLIVTADHGGNGKDHGSDHPFDVTIPWIAWGRGVTPGQITATTVRTMDTASTVLYVLGLEAPRNWMGVPIATAFARLSIIACRSWRTHDRPQCPALLGRSAHSHDHRRRGDEDEGPGSC